jgi:hypothetical protein
MSNQSQPEDSQQASAPVIDDLKSAQKDARQGATMCLLILGMTVLKTLSSEGTDSRVVGLIRAISF